MGHLQMAHSHVLKSCFLLSTAFLIAVIIRCRPSEGLEPSRDGGGHDGVEEVWSQHESVQEAHAPARSVIPMCGHEHFEIFEIFVFV